MDKKENILTPPEIEIHMFDHLYLGHGCGNKWSNVGKIGPFWRIYWNETPGGFIKVGDDEVELTPDKVIVLSPDIVFATRVEHRVKHFYVHCSVGKPFSLVKPNLFELKDSKFPRIAATTAQSVVSGQHDYRTLMKLHMYIYDILLALPQECIPAETQYDPRIAQAIEIIEDSIRKTNEDVASILNMSTNGFLRLFKNETGTTPQAYSRRKRLHDAHIMLSFSDSTIDEIAEKTGFCSRYHFTRVFKQEFSMGPGEFRLKSRKGM